MRQINLGIRIRSAHGRSYTPHEATWVMAYDDIDMYVDRRRSVLLLSLLRSLLKQLQSALVVARPGFGGHHTRAPGCRRRSARLLTLR